MTKDGDGTLCTALKVPCFAPLGGQKRDTITDGYETHAACTTRQVQIPAMTQVALPVRTSSRDTVCMKPSPSVQFRHELRIGNGVHIVASEVPIQLLIANFAMKSRTLPKDTNIPYAERNPHVLLGRDDKIAQCAETALQCSEHTPVAGECVHSREDSSLLCLSTENVKCKPSTGEG